jgi:hypothetical protein
MTGKSQYLLAAIAAIGSFMALPALAASNIIVTFTLNTSCTTTPDGQAQTVSAGTNAPGNGAAQECYIFKDPAGHILTTPTGANIGQPNTNGGLYPAVAGDNEFACLPTFPAGAISPFAFRLPPGTWTLTVWSPPPGWPGNGIAFGAGGASSAPSAVTVAYPAGACPAAVKYTCMEFVTFKTEVAGESGLEPMTTVPVNGMTPTDAASECHAYTRYSFGINMGPIPPYPTPPAPNPSLKAWSDPAEVCKSYAGHPDAYGRKFTGTTRTVQVIDRFAEISGSPQLYNRVAEYTVHCIKGKEVGPIKRDTTLAGGVQPL